MKKFIISIVAFLSLVLLTGCEIKRDLLEDVDIYTTVYPIEFIVDSLYGDKANVYSIYPAEVNLDEYSLTNKQISTYSQCAIFVYNGLTDEKLIARDMLNANTKLKLIRASDGLEYENAIEELWLNPRNYLMIAHNIKNGLEEYITSKYVNDEIDASYEKLKILISKYDAELSAIPINAEDNNIIIGSKGLLFLEKYGFNIISLVYDGNEISSNTMTKIKRLMSEKKVKYIFILDNEEETKEMKELAKAGLKIVRLRTMTVKKESDIANGITYKNMMQEMLDLIKKEMYE